MADESNDRAAYLRKRISLMEWDLSMMQNEELKKSRQTQLNSLRSELNSLIRDAG